MSWQTWSLFAVTETALCVMPGPAVFFVLSQALRRGAGKTVWSILGIVAANTAYFVLSATGIGAILLASYDVFFVIKWAGAAYLVWLGMSAFFARSSVLLPVSRISPGASWGRMFAGGFVLQMSNPKALVFFTALLPQFIDPRAGVWAQVLILAGTSMVIEFCVQLVYAMLAGRATQVAARPTFSKLTNRVAGSLLVAAGIGIAATKQA